MKEVFPRMIEFKVTEREGDKMDQISENRSFTKESISEEKIPNANEEYLQKRRKKFFFQADTKSLSYETYRMEELVETEIMFNYKYFLEFLAYHMLFYIFLGPLAVPIIWYFGGRATVCNQLMWFDGHFSFDVLMQYGQFTFNFLAVFLFYYYSSEITNVYGVEIYMGVASCFLRMCIIASKYATMSYEKMALFKSRVLDPNENRSEWMFVNWRKQLDVVIDAELRSAITRLSIDVSTLFFTFIGEVKPSVTAQLKLNPQENRGASLEWQAKGPESNNEKDAVIFSVPKQKQSVNFQTGIDNVLNKASYFDDIGMLSGFKLARNIIQRVRDQMGDGRLFLISTSISLLHALIPSFFRFYEKKTFIGETATEKTIVISLILINLFYFTVNVAFMIYGVIDFSRQRLLLSQMSNLISATKVVKYRTKKYLPTINFFCPLSLRTWATLQRVFREYGKKFRLRLEMNNSIYLVFYLVVMAVCSLSIFRIIGSLGSATIFVFFFEIVIMFASCVMMIIEGAAINDFFPYHSALIKKNKDIFHDLLSFREIYFDEKKFKQSQNEVYNEGIFLLKKDIAHLSFREQLEEISKVLTELIMICNYTKEELEMNEKNEPFKMLGLKANLNLIQSFIAAIGSLFAAGIQYYFTH